MRSKIFYLNDLYGERCNCCGNVNYCESFECSCKEDTVLFEFDSCDLDNKKEIILETECITCRKIYKIKIIKRKLKRTNK